ncbi:MAG: TlpA disulfide reductase family protein [Bryobacteraceae bacterium]
MLRSILTAFVCLALVLGNLSGAGPVPRPAGEFVVKTIPSGQHLVSQYKGKVVLLTFFLTTCPHCQQSSMILSKLQNEFGPKGLQVLGAAFNPMSHMVITDFIKQFRPTYPVGYASREDVLAYMQHSPIMQLYVPIILLIDKKGVIQHQFMGEDPIMQNQEKGLRELIEVMLKEGPSSMKKTSSTAKK